MSDEGCRREGCFLIVFKVKNKKKTPVVLRNKTDSAKSWLLNPNGSGKLVADFT